MKILLKISDFCTKNVLMKYNKKAYKTNIQFIIEGLKSYYKTSCLTGLVHCVLLRNHSIDLFIKKNIITHDFYVKIFFYILLQLVLEVIDFSCLSTSCDLS